MFSKHSQIEYLVDRVWINRYVPYMKQGQINELLDHKPNRMKNTRSITNAKSQNCIVKILSLEFLCSILRRCRFYPIVTFSTF